MYYFRKKVSNMPGQQDNQQSKTPERLTIIALVAAVLVLLLGLVSSAFSATAQQDSAKGVCPPFYVLDAEGKVIDPVHTRMRRAHTRQNRRAESVTTTRRSPKATVLPWERARNRRRIRRPAVSGCSVRGCTAVRGPRLVRFSGGSRPKEMRRRKPWT